MAVTHDELVQAKVSTELLMRLNAFCKRTGKTRADVVREFLDLGLSGGRKPIKNRSAIDIDANEAALAHIIGTNALLELVAQQDPKRAAVLAIDVAVQFQRWADQAAKSAGTTSERLYRRREKAGAK